MSSGGELCTPRNSPVDIEMHASGAPAAAWPFGGRRRRRGQRLSVHISCVHVEASQSSIPLSAWLRQGASEP